MLIQIAELTSSMATFLWLPNATNNLHHRFGGSFQFLIITGLTLSTATFGLGFLLSCVADGTNVSG
ncbi:hypothetical protein PG990_011809 [Apiospora arundinis]